MVVGNVTILCLIHSIFIVIIGLTFLDPILLFFGATDETIGYAREFMYIIILGTPISYVFLGLNNLMRATGYPRKAMVSALLSVGVNIVAAPVMIFVLDRGIAGAAMATIMGQSAAFIWVLWHFMSKKSYIHFTRECWRISGELIRRIYSIGLSPFLMNCCACLVVVFINKGSFGECRCRRQSCGRGIWYHQPHNHVLCHDNFRNHAGHAAYFGL